MIQKPISSNLEDIIKYIKDLSKDSNEKAIYDLREMYSKFPKHFDQLESDFKNYNKKADKEDKDFLYQELINLEVIRYSLQLKLNDTKEFHQKKELENKLLNISLKVVYLRAIIIFYGKSGKKCELLVKELLENERH